MRLTDRAKPMKITLESSTARDSIDALKQYQKLDNLLRKPQENDTGLCQSKKHLVNTAEAKGFITDGLTTK